ncbi:MAG TPA: hypothetical protein VH475_01110 [Tepidisphaeraceae bacterium]
MDSRIGKAGFFTAAVIGAAAFASVDASAQAIFAPTDGPGVIGGRSDGTSFLVGAVGVDGGNNVYTDNVWPAAESPDHIIDGFGQKYLNFAELNTGVIVTPAFNGGGGSVARSLKFWTANDTPGRDPVTYQLLGTNNTITGAGPFPLSNFTLISSGTLSLPASRNAGGTTAPLDDANSQLVSFANSTSYKTYMLLVPTIKDEPTVNSMQVAEIQLFTTVPEPSCFAVAGVGGLLLASRRRR